MIYLSLSSNLGNRADYLFRAKEAIANIGFEISNESILLETEAILLPNSPAEWNLPYLNMIICGFFDGAPQELLTKLQSIETSLGRKANHLKWSPRTVDIDILLWDALEIDSPELIIPHPELFKRNFIIHLLALLNPELRPLNRSDPALYKSIGEIAHLTQASQHSFLRSLTLRAKLFGILNITPNSFSDGGQYLDSSLAFQRALELSEEGAYAVDIGAQSTRSGASIVGAKEELRNLEPVFELIQARSRDKGYNINLSLDSFTEEVISSLFKRYDISWFNLQKLELSSKTLKLIAEKGAGVIVMHATAVPASKDKIISHDKNPTDEIIAWASNTLTHLKNHGFLEKQIVIDPGLGFGKSKYQDIYLLRSVKALKEAGYKVMIGHSRKSYIQSFVNSEALERDLETVAASDRLIDLGVDYLRVHQVSLHQRFLSAKTAIFGA